jgi:tripartite-type tricarboxylate transporter receptor subunit TctC
MMQLPNRRLFNQTLVALASSALSVPSRAQAYPAKPVTIVVPFAPGGPTDTQTRLLASQVQGILGVRVLTENKSGAGGNVGAAYAARAPADGYTLLMGTNGTLAANVALFEKLAYNPATDFEPVVMFTHMPNMLVVHPSVPAKNVPELVGYLKAHPDLPYGSGGIGTSSHFAGELFKKMTGVRMDHVSYRGDGQSLPDLIAGNIKICFCSVLAGMKWLPNGELRALGVTSASRVPAVKQLPTIAEQGLPGYDVTSWYAIVAPAGTPQDVVRTLNGAFVKAMANAEFKSKMEAMGAILVPSTPEQLKEFVAKEMPRWAKLVQDAGVKL